MTNKLIVILVIMGQFQVLMAQSGAPKILHGTVTFNSISPLEGITVTHNNSKRMVVSDQYGLFSILASAGDILSFSGVNYETLRKIITKEQFITGTFTADLTLKSIELKEIIIKDHSKITAENLGIIPKDQIKLTAAERRLQTAGDFKPIHLLGLLGGSLQVDPILNAINGRTKRLKKEVSIEKKELLMVHLQGLFEDHYYMNTLKIPEELIRGFQYYCIEDVSFVKALKDKNKTMTIFLIVGLASEFNKKQKKYAE